MSTTTGQISGPGTPVPLHRSPHACPVCGEVLYYNYCARPKQGDGYYLFGHRTPLGLLTFSLEKSEVAAYGGFGTTRTADRIAEGGAGVHLALDAVDKEGKPWLIALRAYILHRVKLLNGGAAGIAEEGASW